MDSGLIGGAILTNLQKFEAMDEIKIIADIYFVSSSQNDAALNNKLLSKYKSLSTYPIYIELWNSSNIEIIKIGNWI